MLKKGGTWSYKIELAIPRLKLWSSRLGGLTPGSSSGTEITMAQEISYLMFTQHVQKCWIVNTAVSTDAEVKETKKAHVVSFLCSQMLAGVYFLAQECSVSLGIGRVFVSLSLLNVGASSGFPPTSPFPPLREKKSKLTSNFISDFVIFLRIRIWDGFLSDCFSLPSMGSQGVTKTSWRVQGWLEGACSPCDGGIYVEGGTLLSVVQNKKPGHWGLKRRVFLSLNSGSGPSGGNPQSWACRETKTLSLRIISQFKKGELFFGSILKTSLHWQIRGSQKSNVLTFVYCASRIAGSNVSWVFRFSFASAC